MHKTARIMEETAYKFLTAYLDLRNQLSFQKIKKLLKVKIFFKI